MSAEKISTYPLYLTQKEAAAYTGIGERAIADFVNSQNPPPLLIIGTRKYIQRDGLSDYLKEKQTWRFKHERKN